MLRETDPQTTIWELLLPDEAKRLPAELTQVDTYLDDERFIAPWRALFDRRLGRPIGAGQHAAAAAVFEVPLPTGLREPVPGGGRRPAWLSAG